MKLILPEVMVLLLFLLGDLLWDGLASAAAGVAAGLSAYLILLAFRRNKPGLMLEGLIFGAVTALGEVADYPGGTLILMELLIGTALVGSTLAGKNILKRMVGEIGKGLFSRRQYGILSLVSGSLFLIHSIICTALFTQGLLNLPTGAVLFAVLYLTALKIISQRMKSEGRDTFPLIIQEDTGNCRLDIRGRVSGKFSLENRGRTASVADVVLTDVPVHEFLTQLEAVLKGRGTDIISMRNWSGDEIELEMRGYAFLNGEWRKRLK